MWDGKMFTLGRNVKFSVYMANGGILKNAVAVLKRAKGWENPYKPRRLSPHCYWLIDSLDPMENIIIWRWHRGTGIAQEIGICVRH